MRTALLFSGQGSQYVGMMKDLTTSYTHANELVSVADKILGIELSDICFNGPAETLKETRYTQPALFLHSAVLTDLLKQKIEFHAVAGHSVGEYSALYAAGVLSFENALNLVAFRGELMFNAGKYESGTMFAVINLSDEKVVEVCKNLTDESKGLYVVPANYNSPGQIVVSGSAEHLRNNVDAFKQAGARLVKELVVSGAFHSPLMEPAKQELERKILNTEFSDAKVPVYVNFTAKPLVKSEDIKEALIAQLTSPVLWTQTLSNMKTDGIYRYIELGPGKVLQGLVKRSISGVEIDGIDKAEDILKYF
ncbi:ACP S-malonyltransferase [Bacteroidota bacterium]